MSNNITRLRKVTHSELLIQNLVKPGKVRCSEHEGIVIPASHAVQLHDLYIANDLLSQIKINVCAICCLKTLHEKYFKLTEIKIMDLCLYQKPHIITKKQEIPRCVFVKEEGQNYASFLDKDPDDDEYEMEEKIHYFDNIDKGETATEDVEEEVSIDLHTDEEEEENDVVRPRPYDRLEENSLGERDLTDSDFDSD